MKMGEMPRFEKKADSGKDYKKFESVKNRAQKEAEKNAKKMEGGAGADNPSGAASQSANFQSEFDDLLQSIYGLQGSGSSYGTPSGSTSGDEPNDENDDKAPSDEFEKDILPGAKAPDDDRFSSPDEEIEKIRKEIEEKFAEMGAEDDFDKERILSKALTEYSNVEHGLVLKDSFAMKEGSIMREVLKLEPEEHDEQIEALLKMIPEKGVKNVMRMVKRLGSAHIEDDFHRALVQYFMNSLPGSQIKDKELKKDMELVLYEVRIGSENPVEQEQGIKQEKVSSLERLLNTMEQFYAGMLSVSGSSATFSIELAKPVGQENLNFYVSVPKGKEKLFEQHILSVYPDAIFKVQSNDFNVFSYGGEHKVSLARLSKHFSAPLKNYKRFTHDPMNIILGAFSGMNINEGAAIQFVIGDDGDKHNSLAQKVVTNLRKNKSFAKAVKHAESPAQVAKDELKKHFKEAIFGEDKTKPDPIDESLLQEVVEKANSRIVPLNVRLVASSSDSMRASTILSALESSFNQFENPRVNKLEFSQVSGASLRDEIDKFIYRRFDDTKKIMLSLTELSTVLHLTGAGIRTSRELNKVQFKRGAAPVEVSSVYAEYSSGEKKGVILGENVFGAQKLDVVFLEEDRMRHFYEIGQTGTGKSYLMKSMIIQDILNGEGVCYIDPHGTDIEDVLSAVPAERADDVIYFDPSHTARPYGLNILEWDEKYPEQKTFVTNELFEIFVKLFGDVPESLGPMFQQYFRNATMLALEGQKAGEATMADIPKVFADSEFRHELLRKSKNPIVNQFWVKIAEVAQGDPSLENVTPYITAKTDTFLANDIMRPIIAQKESSMNFREIMDKRKILLVNLSKGKIGELNAQLLGLIVVGKFLQAALSRVDELGSGANLPPFYLYIDEFQNFTTPSIATILSEARKYKLSLNLAHQFIKQLDEKIKDAVFGNVGTKCAFRVSSEDAEFLEKSFAPQFGAKDLMSIENYNAYLSLLVKGTPVRAFDIRTKTYNWKFNKEYAQKLKELSFLKYGKEREKIEKEIAERYMPDLESEKKAPPLPWL